MSRTHELQFLLESARGRGTAEDRARWASLVEINGEERALLRLSQWLSSGPTWDDDPDDEDHVDDMLLARAAEETALLFERPELLAHLGRCDECLETFDAALVERLRAEEGGGGSITRILPWVAAAASVLFLFGFLAFRGGGDAWSAAELATLEPLPVRTLRSAPDEGAFGEAFRTGLEHYAAGAFPEAEFDLARAVALEPTQLEARLYWASSLLLLERAEDVHDALLPALAADAPPQVRDEANWLVAQAWLLGGSADRALEALERRSPDAERHATDAARQLAELRARRDG